MSVGKGFFLILANFRQNPFSTVRHGCFLDTRLKNLVNKNKKVNLWLTPEILPEEWLRKLLDLFDTRNKEKTGVTIIIFYSADNPPLYNLERAIGGIKLDYLPH